MGFFLYLGFGEDSADEEGVGVPRPCFLSASWEIPGRKDRQVCTKRDGTTHSLAKHGPEAAGSPRPIGALETGTVKGPSLHPLIFLRPLLKCHPLTEAFSQYPFKTTTWHSDPLTLFYFAFLKYEIYHLVNTLLKSLICCFLFVLLECEFHEDRDL